MSTSCEPAPQNKREFISDIGEILVEDNGKKKYYTPEEVKKAHRNSKWYDYVDWSCWALSIFSSHTDFDLYHEKTGEACDYVAMKTEMLSGLSVSTVTDWTDIPDLDIDASWLDFGDVFDGLLKGVGEFVSGIFDGI